MENFLFSELDESSSMSSVLFSGSKKIFKSKKQSFISTESSSPKKNYDKTPPKEKKSIMVAIMKELASILGLGSFSYEKEESNLDKWRNYLGDLDPNEFNGILMKVMPRYKPDLVLSQEKLTQLRKKTKAWFVSPKKAETRGGALIYDEELPEFKEALKKIIRQMTEMRSRNFSSLQSQVIPIIEQIHKKSGLKRTTKKNMFSKRYWNGFLHRDDTKDIQALWNQVPKKHSRNATTNQPAESEEQQDETDFSEQDKSVSYHQIPGAADLSDWCSSPLTEGMDPTALKYWASISIDLEVETEAETNELVGVSSREEPCGGKFVLDADFSLPNTFMEDFNTSQRTDEIKWFNHLRSEGTEQQPIEERLLTTQTWSDFNLDNDWVKSSW